MDWDEKIHIFTYGTLMKGMSNERVLTGFPHKNIPATISGVDLYDVGSFPAMVKGIHSYQGELLVFEDSVDVRALYYSMDRLEGYHKDYLENSLYLRVPVRVSVDGELVDTEAYFWNQPFDRLTYIDSEKYSGYRDYLSKKGR